MVLFAPKSLTRPLPGEREKLLTFRSKARRARVAEMERFVFEVRGFHLNRQVIDAEAIVQFSPQFLQ